MGFDIETRTKVIILLSERVVSKSVLRLGPQCLEFFLVTFPFLGNNNLELPGELDCKRYSLIFRYTQRVY